MSRTHKDSPKYRQAQKQNGKGQPRKIRVRAVRRDEPDLRKLGRALIQLASAQSEADAQAQLRDGGAEREEPDD
jgi:hypothetical protein